MKKILVILVLIYSNCSAQMGEQFYINMLGTPPNPSPFQAETRKYFDSLVANGFTVDSAKFKAIDTFIRDMKGFSNPSYATSNIMTKMKVFYPFYGATAVYNSFNLINSATYKMTWVGSPTHNTTGVVFNGSSQYGNTGYQSATVYDRNMTIDISAFSGSGWLCGVFASNVWGVQINATTYKVVALGLNTLVGTSSLGTGLSQYDMDVKDNTTASFYSNGVSASTTTPTTLPAASWNIYVGALNQSGTAGNYANTTVRIFALTNSLTATEHTNLYNSIQALKTKLGK